VSYRRGSLDEVVLGLGWVSAVLGGLVIAGSLAARRAGKPGPWRAAMMLAPLIPYVIFIAYILLGLCNALDT